MEKINDLEMKKSLHRNIKHLTPSVTFEQVWDKYSNQSKGNEDIISRKTIKVRRRPVWMIATALFLFASVSVSAAILPIDWNGIKISILNDNGKNERIDSAKELIFGTQPTYKAMIEDTLKHSINMKETLTLDEAKKEFPFPILRPVHTDMTPTQSIGALMNQTIQENKGIVRIVGYTPIFHDFYEKDNIWIVVSQSLDEEATKSLQADSQKMSSQTYVGNWETVQVTDQTFAIFKDDGKESSLLLQYKTDNLKVVELKLIGNVAKEDLIKLAKAYIGEK